jgi:flagellin
LSTLQTIDGGMNNISLLLDRARTLATQSASGGFTGSRGVLNSEFQSVLTEINRQAQSIGLDQNGEFAKALSVFIGGGKGVSSPDAITNGSVTVDLSQSVVDTTALGLDSFRAVGSGYDLGSTSSTSVKAILLNATNTGTEAVSGTTQFTFTGAGFSGTDAVTIDVNVAGVKDTEGLVKAVNAAIEEQATKVGANFTAFKNAGVAASVITDANGRQQLSFSAPSAAFQVKAADKVANAFLGNIEDNATGLGKTLKSYVTSGHLPSAGASATGYVYTINGTDLSVTMVAGDDIDLVVSKFNTAIAAAGTDDLIEDKFVAVKEGSNQVRIESVDGSSFTLGGNAVTAADLGLTDLTVLGATAAVSTQANSLLSGGAKTSTQFGDDKAFTFALFTGGNSQNVTFAGVHADGSQYDWSVGLDATVAADIDEAVAYVNDQLQASGDPSLAKIVAVKSADTTGALGIKFLSSDDFSVKFSAVTGTEGLSDGSSGATAQNAVLYSATSAGSGLADISNKTTAAQAVAALAAAVSTLGDAQAVVGKGQNNFNFAINLAQSQVSNLAAAESRIRDADLASEAANLTKAQILIQAGTAALAQANSAPQAVLSLLRG